MMSIDQVRELDKRSDAKKLLPTTIEFLKSMREIANSGRARNDLPVIPWTAEDERRF
jgi:hypothetical protein